MQNQETQEYKILDWIIYSLFVIFLLSLSNSIFVNQIGYFGALLFIIIKAFLTRKNPFTYTGLELAFALYMLAEILSLIFSEYKAQAFHNFTKRALIIPVLYTTIAATKNLKRGKIFFKIFIGASLITGLVYLIISAQFYLTNQYSFNESGPTIFQHPITASEIISFSVLFLFAFILNEKTDWKTKLLLYSGFAISVFTLIATFKRTGWIGVVGGIVLILILKRKWKILLLVFVSGTVLFLIDKNISQVNVYNFAEDNAKRLYSFETEGRANSILHEDSIIIVSDYENGILFYKDSTFIKQIKTPAPVTVLLKISDTLYLAKLIDTRFLIFKKDDMEFNLVNEILPPGYTKYFEVFNESLYILDSDSGLTIYESLTNKYEPIRNPEFKKFRWLFVDSSYIYFLNEKSEIKIFSKNGALPDILLDENKFNDIQRAYLFNGKLLVCNQNDLGIFTVHNNKIVLNDNLLPLKNVHRIISDGEVLTVLTKEGTIYKYMINDSLKFEQIDKVKVSPPPTNILFSEGKLYCSYIKRGRLLSFFDPYMPQNFTRLALWRGGIEIFKDYPLFGVGDIGIEKYYVKYKRPYDKEIHGHLHNNYFHFLATLGLFGLLVLIYLFIKMFKTMANYYKESKGKPFVNSYVLGAIASLACILISGLTELNFWDQEIATLVYFTVGLSIAVYNHRKDNINSPN